MRCQREKPGVKLTGNFRQHGLEPQTLESIRLLRDNKTPFVVALNKIDRLYGWMPMKDGGFRQTLAQQERPVQREFENRLQETIVAFAEQGLNAVPYYDNKNFSKYVSLVPTSAHTGEGVPDLLMLLVKLTQERMANNLMYISTLQCTVLEVKVIEGLGTTIDVVLVNGYLHEGDKIVLCGLNGAIVTQVRALLTPQPMKELRIKVCRSVMSAAAASQALNLSRVPRVNTSTTSRSRRRWVSRSSHQISKRPSQAPDCSYAPRTTTRTSCARRSCPT